MSIDGRVKEVPHGHIKIGTRHRLDLGDLSSLSDSIRQVGLLHPVVVDSLNNLIAGHRRFEAWKLVYPGAAVPCHVVCSLDDPALALRAERDENACRKEMLASELYELGVALERLERPKAITRKSMNALKTNGPMEPFVSESGRVSEIVAPILGVSSSTWRRLKPLGDAAKAGDEDAKKDLEAIDAGDLSIRQADRRRLARAKPPAPEQTAGQQPAIVGDPRTLPRRRSDSLMLARLVDQLGHYAQELERLDLDSIDGAATLADQLSSFRTVITKTINRLRSIAA